MVRQPPIMLARDRGRFAVELEHLRYELFPPELLETGFPAMS